jgi:hypothetical protein
MRLSGKAFTFFCVFRDYGADRNIRKALDTFDKDKINVKNGMEFGVTGLFNTAGKKGLRIMTVTLKT